jgi:hypothetical protein
LLRLAQPAGAHVLTPLLGRPFEPAHVEGPTPWWRAAGASRAALPLGAMTEPEH